MNIKSSYIKVLVILFTTAGTFLDGQEVTLKQRLEANNGILYARTVRFEDADHDNVVISLSYPEPGACFRENMKNKGISNRIIDLEGIDSCNVIIDDNPKSIAITEVPHLALKIKGNDLKKIPESIGNLRNLELLDISHNQIEHLPTSISSLHNLTALMLSCNELAELPHDIINLEQLKILDIGHNPNIEIPVEINKLKNLRKLYAAFTRKKFMKLLPELIGDLISLEVLELSYNALEQLPESIGHLENLRELHIENNRFKELPDIIRNLPNIENVYAQNNQLDRLPLWVKDCPAWIHIEGNNITFPGWQNSN